MPITGDWQAMLDGSMIADGDQLHLLDVEGLGEPAPKSQDVNLDLADGEVFGPDFSSKRVLGLTVIARAASGCTDDKAASALLKARTVVALWPPSGTKLLTVRMPGWGTWFVYGRCRGVQMKVTDVSHGVVQMLLQFESQTSAIGWS